MHEGFAVKRVEKLLKVLPTNLKPQTSRKIALDLLLTLGYVGHGAAMFPSNTMGLLRGAHAHARASSDFRCLWILDQLS